MELDEWGAGPKPEPAGPNLERQERLEYLADLLKELQVLAEREGCQDLQKLLVLSCAEATREARRQAR